MSDKDTHLEEWEAPDKSFRKIIVKAGHIGKKPLHESSCRCNVLSDEEGIVGLGSGVRTKTLVIGDVSSEVELILEKCLMTMNTEEVCDLLFTLPLSITVPYVPKAAYLHCGNRPATDRSNVSRAQGDTMKDSNKEAGDVSHNRGAPPEKPVVTPKSYRVRIELETFSNVPHVCDMTSADKWRHACEHRDKGSQLFSTKHYRWAFRHFSWSYKYVISLEHDNVPDDVTRQLELDIQGLKLKCLLNLAACQLQNYTYDHAVENCTLALEIDPNNVKALYRRGTALIQLQEYERAKCDLEQAKHLDPKNTAVDTQLEIVKERTCKLNRYFAVAMKKLFQ
ncbi:uncharacterized protein [Dermacentor andersoni]|uniref:uncharacterized protein n=1 Tax=Dermacentor andersoni TaxID=34620 RepID=UPI0021556FF6|nr:uncharacterized protein LOC126547934 [Dermacentor andersoni]XP_054919447.1 uncharacterized protein LOC126547934 [Dermacentor andersoni]